MTKTIFIRFISTLIASLVIAGYALAGEAAQKKVAVMPFECVSGHEEKRAADMLTDLVTVALTKSGKYTVLERTQLEKAIREIGFQHSGTIDPGQAIEFGKMTGTDYTIVGKVLMAGIVENLLGTKSGDIFAGGCNPWGKFIPKWKGKVVFDVRFIDNATGKVVFAESVEGSKAGNDKAVCLYNACQSAAGYLLKQIRESISLGATVLKVHNGRVYLNAGSCEGLEKGDILIVFTEAEPVRDLDGSILTVVTEDVGKIKVLEAQAAYSVCQILSGGDSIKQYAKVRRATK